MRKDKRYNFISNTLIAFLSEGPLTRGAMRGGVA